MASVSAPSMRYFTPTSVSRVSMWMSLARRSSAVKMMVSTSRMIGLDSSWVIFSIVMVSSPLSSSRMSCSLKPSVASSSMRCEDSDFLSRS